MARSASGRRSAKSTGPPASSAAGCIRRAICLNKLPKGLQNKAKGHLQDIWMAETRKDAETAFDFFLEAYGPKYEKATACLAKDWDALLSFYDFPAEHWKHVRTTNPIESTFATVRLRTYRGQGLPVDARRRWPWSRSSFARGPARNGGGSMRSDQFAGDHSRRQIREWRTPGSRRRMTNPYTTFDNSSPSDPTVPKLCPAYSGLFDFIRFYSDTACDDARTKC